MSNTRSVTIVGVGLIGGSIGLALRERDPSVSIVGFGSRETTLNTALQLGAITEIAASAEKAVADADLVIVCAPVDHIVERVRQLAPHCRPGTLLTDAGSTKQAIVGQLAHVAETESWPPGVSFVGSHPLAGNDKSGPQHALADLFQERTVVITPHAASLAADVERLQDFWSFLGAEVVTMSGEQHDKALAVTSHLPHLLAAVLAGVTPESYVALTAGGWQDTTRIAAGDPVLWRQIMLANRENLLAALEDWKQSLETWQAALTAADASRLEELLDAAKRIRDLVNGPRH